MLGTQFLPQEQPPSAASKGLRLKPDVSQIGCDQQACDAGAAHVEGEATSHSGSAQARLMLHLLVIVVLAQSGARFRRERR